MTKKVYLDYSATTPVREEVADAMRDYLLSGWGNPSSTHYFGREAKKGVEEARDAVAALIKAKAEEIIFTSGGTEADNLALFGAARAYHQKGNHIITSAIEHHAVLDSAKALAAEGFKVTFLPVTSDGLIKVEDVEAAITPQTILISVMHVNNEIGTIQPIEEIGALARKRGIIFHTDAVQSAGKLPLDVNELQVDLLSLSAHKIYGPKGTGALFIRQGINLKPLIYGGGQEKGIRPGTENVAGIVGLGKAALLATEEMEEETERETILRDKLKEGLLERIPGIKINGSLSRRVCNNLNLSIPGIEGEALLLNLDLKGIASSSGSACTAGSTEPSHVLLALGLTPREAEGSIRLSLGRWTTDEEIDYVLDVLPEIVARLRAISL